MNAPFSARLPLAALPFLALLLLAPGLGAQEEPTVIFLVRHAEKADSPAEDPPLTREGEGRAEALAHVLGSAELDHIHSTATRRTRATAEPIRRRTGLSVRSYDGDALGILAAHLRETPGRHLVVGHSDTTPELVRLLGGDGGAPIVEAWEYDRLYVVTLRGGSPPTTVLLRFGEPATR